jgi:hypothetical protein
MTDQRVYIATRDVRHIAASIADTNQPDRDYTARTYRPICGAVATVVWPNTHDSPRLLFGADTGNGDTRWGKPLCLRCRHEAVTIMDAAFAVTL